MKLTKLFGIAALIGIVTFQTSDIDAPANMLTVYDRAAWGIGEDGTRIAPQPETIHIILD